MTDGRGSAQATENVPGLSRKEATPNPSNVSAELDDFGLPSRPSSRVQPSHPDSSDDDEDDAAFHDANDTTEAAKSADKNARDHSKATLPPVNAPQQVDGSADSKPATQSPEGVPTDDRLDVSRKQHRQEEDDRSVRGDFDGANGKSSGNDGITEETAVEPPINGRPKTPVQEEQSTDPRTPDRSTPSPTASRAFPSIKKEKRKSAAAVSEWSHQRLAARKDESDEEEEVEWQAMPALGEMDYYDDRGRLVAKGARDEMPDKAGYQATGFSSKGYTKVLLDEDAQSATSMDDDTNYLFKKDDKYTNIPDPYGDDDDDDEDLARDSKAQLQNTKDLLSEGQRIAYVSVARLTIIKMIKALEEVEKTKGVRKDLIRALENMEIWGQQMMVRLYSHMEIDSAEQIMIEQLAEHGVGPSDLVPTLMQNARIKNPNADTKADSDPSTEKEAESRVSGGSDRHASRTETELKEVKEGEEVPEVQDSLPRTESIELDLRWTVLCDLFLVLISDGNYDSRSRRLLERVATSMQVTWQQICRFEKRIVEALEMQEAELQEDHDESDNLEARRKAALKRKYITMGLVTVGGAAVIGLSAGLLAPLIGAGLAAGFTTIGVGGTGAFLTGVGGAAIVTSIGVTTGGTIALRASDRRMGHVKTFEYRPLHNNKRLNLILTVSGWMAGKVDDVRLPFSTVDPVMGDIYSLLWEPDMLRSTGDTINILATEALTQTIQQVLGMTLLVGLMSAIQLPIVLTKLAYLIDNPWSVSLDRATAAGLILADSLIQRHLGTRPITLVGFSLGARVIFSCLKELSERGAYGIVQNVYLFGAPITAKRDEYLKARSVIAGRFVNGYASNDWILGYLFRATAGGLSRVAGLATVDDIPGLENKDVSAFVNGHMAYRAAMPRLLREVGWEVESDEFIEIEDPDPENHEARQRELIKEIDDARKKAEAEESAGKKRFGFFSKKAKPQKAWENYDASDSKRSSTDGKKEGDELNVLFDIDAIRKELASEYVEVRELDSTMPTMQIVTTGKDGEKQTDYLRLPSDITLTPEEMARIKLPPKPEDDGHGATPTPRLPQLTKSLQPSPRQSPGQSPHPSPRASFQTGPIRGTSPKPDEDSWMQPRELVSTLPPLNLTPSISQRPSFEPAPAYRPALKSHATEPAPSSKPSSGPGSALASPVETYNLEHNAWADDSVKMTFE
jgi:hypothetical protein